MEAPSRIGRPSAYPARQGPRDSQGPALSRGTNANYGQRVLRKSASATTGRLRTAWARSLLPLLLVLMVPGAVQAQLYSNNYGFWSYTATNGTVTIRGYSGFGGAVAIPNEVNGLPVVSIGDGALWGQNELSSVTISTNVTNVGYDAFGDCENLVSVTIPNSVATIGEGAFGGCKSLTSVTIPNSVISIMGDGAFSYCWSLTNVTIGNGVTGIGEETFTYDWRLANVTIGESLTNIGFNAFAFCGGLTSVTIGRSLSSISTAAFYSCSNLASVYCQGDAPSLGLGVFDVANIATIYYLPGTTGWSNTLGDRPTVLWNPQVQPGSVGIRSNQFGFNITGTSNLVVVIEAATNLANPTWQPLQTNTLNGISLYFSDPQWSNYAGRFYRVAWP